MAALIEYFLRQDRYDLSKRNSIELDPDSNEAQAMNQMRDIVLAPNTDFYNIISQIFADGPDKYAVLCYREKKPRSETENREWQYIEYRFKKSGWSTIGGNEIIACVHSAWAENGVSQHTYDPPPGSHEQGQPDGQAQLQTRDQLQGRSQEQQRPDNTTGADNTGFVSGSFGGVEQ